MRRGLTILGVLGMALAAPTIVLAQGPSPSSSPATPLRGAGGTILFEQTAWDGAPAAFDAISPDGTGLRELVKDPQYACCGIPSPDGSLVSFAVGTPDGRITTATMNVDGSGYQTMDLPDATISLGGLWLRDGRMAFAGWNDKDASVDGVYIGDPTDPAHLTRLTSNETGASDWPLNSSPDSTRITFVRAPKDSDSGELWVVGVDGSNQHRLTPDGTTAELDSYWGEAASWSPDGTQLAFVGKTSSCPRCDLYVVNADGTGAHRIIQTKGTMTSAHWSPDGQWILFDSQTPSSTLDQIWRVHPDGTGAQVITSPSDGGGAWDPQFSPDGTRIVYSQGNPPGLDLWTANLDGSDAVQVTPGPSNYFWYHWVP